MEKNIVINIKELRGEKIMGFELNEISEDEAIVILQRCLFKLLEGYDDYLKVEKKTSKF